MRVNILLALAISLLLSKCSEEPSMADSYAMDDTAVKRGKLIFAGTCAGYCHKVSPQRSDAPYLFDCEWVHGGSDQEIYTTIKEGVPGTRMIGFGENFPEGADDLWKVIAYLKVNRQACG